MRQGFVGEGNSSKNTIFFETEFEEQGGYANGPERDLISALLFDGVMACMCYMAGKSLRYREAYNWVNTRNLEYVFSFDNVCEALGINADGLRLGLINTTKSRSLKWKRSRRTR